MEHHRDCSCPVCQLHAHGYRELEPEDIDLDFSIDPEDEHNPRMPYIPADSNYRHPRRRVRPLVQPHSRTRVQTQERGHAYYVHTTGGEGRARYIRAGTSIPQPAPSLPEEPQTPLLWSLEMGRFMEIREWVRYAPRVQSGDWWLDHTIVLVWDEFRREWVAMNVARAWRELGERWPVRARVDQLELGSAGWYEREGWVNIMWDPAQILEYR